jgi:membrane protein implicated in regulation of membrane protease activity
VKAFTVKAWVGGVGFIVGLAGIALEIEWIVWIGVGFLSAAFLLRFVKPSPADSGGVDA